MTFLTFLSKLSTWASWRTCAVVFALVNLKAVPLAWHVRLLYRTFRNWYSDARVKAALKSLAESPSPTTHPIFETVSLLSRSPWLECDYNIHKSNSTYFADLDESRSMLVTKLLLPSLGRGTKALEDEGHKGHLAIVLGSVHTSFHREIRPYELYEIRSRILGWDNKWIVIGSWFVRPARPGHAAVVLASSLSKYVVKKGRFTVAPERCLHLAGWLPPRPDDGTSGAAEASQTAEEPGVPEPPTPVSTSTLSSDLSLVATPEAEGLRARVPGEAVASATAILAKLESAADQAPSPPVEPLEPPKVGDWDWHRIEMERLRGLQAVAGWLALEKELLDEFVRP